MRLTLLLALLPTLAPATTWHVGPTRTYQYCSQVAPLVADGDTIEIDYTVYYNDPQVQWTRNNLYIHGVGGRPRLEAGPIIAGDVSNGKGIFVTKGHNITIDNIEFANARVPDNNGAGIRQEGRNLTVTRCRFVSNEMGILCGNIADSKTTVEYSEFVNGGSTFNPGYQHNIYINHIDTLVFRYNYTYDAIAQGHELKSRATYNFILYNRIANETTEDSRTIDLPNGGVSVIVGNVITQGPLSANTNLVGYGLEGLNNPAPHVLYCINNTFVNHKDKGSFIQVANGTDSLVLHNNILAGARTGGLILGTPAVLDSSHNRVDTDLGSFAFVDVDAFDYHLLADSPCKDAGVLVNGTAYGHELFPVKEYVDTCLYTERLVYGLPDIGAYEYAVPSGTTSIASIDFDVFPNPAADVLYVILGEGQAGPGRVDLVDMAGRVVRSWESHGAERLDLDLTGILSGMFALRVQGKNEIGVTQVVIR